MKYAAIEIGTNSTKMIIAQKDDPDSYSILRKRNTVNRLSRNMFENSMIQQEAFRNGMNIIHKYMKDIEGNKAELVSIFSTSVLRDADNGSLFTQEVKRRYGCDVDVISGEREAFYAYKAASRLMGPEDDKSIIVDIGGGSTEIIFGDKENIAHRISLDIGAVRLTELYYRNNSVTDEQIHQIACKVKEELRQIPDMTHQSIVLIGTGGTIKTMATIYSAVDYRNEKSINGITIPRNAANDILQKLIKMDIKTRKTVKGLNPKRADVIIAGLQILQEVMEKFKANQIKICSAGVLEGFIEHFISQHSGCCGQPFSDTVKSC